MAGRKAHRIRWSDRGQWSLAALLLVAAGGHAGVPAFDFVTIPGGSFLMGTVDLDEVLIEIPPDAKVSVADEQPAHEVRVSAFELGVHEVTQAQWYEVMGTRPGPDDHWQRQDWARLPVVSVSWQDAQRFVEQLNRADRKYRYRLPTEAEWEYAARAGSTALRPFAEEDMNRHAWTITNSGDQPQPVGGLLSNAFGLHDMYGNAWEWVSDWYAPGTYRRGAVSDPTGPAEGRLKVRRGGSYHCAPHLVRAGYRAADPPNRRYSVLGFRLLREAIKRPQETMGATK